MMTRGGVAIPRHRQVRRACVLAAALVLASSCGSDPEPAAEGASGRSASTPSEGSCGGLELAAAAELLGCSAVDIASAIEDGSTVHCVMSCGDDPQLGVAFSVATYPDPDVAEAVLGGMRRAVERTGAVSPLSGVGESAWASEGTVPRLAARAGATIVEVTQPPDPEGQRRAAAAILEAQ